MADVNTEPLQRSKLAIASNAWLRPNILSKKRRKRGDDLRNNYLVIYDPAKSADLVMYDPAKSADLVIYDQDSF